MATKCKPQGPRCNKFEIWTKVAKLAKPQGPKRQFTHLIIYNVILKVSTKFRSCHSGYRKWLDT
ncbi:hypothetical protein Hanom_Chr07g00637471 [Helianthus anomalus]